MGESRARHTTTRGLKTALCGVYTRTHAFFANALFTPEKETFQAGGFRPFCCIYEWFSAYSHFTVQAVVGQRTRVLSFRVPLGL